MAQKVIILVSPAILFTVKLTILPPHTQIVHAANRSSKKGNYLWFDWEQNRARNHIHPVTCLRPYVTHIGPFFVWGSDVRNRCNLTVLHL